MALMLGSSLSSVRENGTFRGAENGKPIGFLKDEYTSSEATNGGRHGFPPQHCPVLIIGGGPVGLCAAILLAKRGISSVVLERHLHRRCQPKAHALNPRSLEILRQAGLDTVRLRALGASAKDADAVRFVVSMRGLEIGNLPYERQDKAVKAVTPEPLFNVAQSILERFLWQAALETGAVTVWAGFQWQSCVELDKNSISSTVLNRQTGSKFTIQSKYLLGCDGAHSRSREQFQIPFETLDGQPPRPIHYVSVNFNADLSKEKTGSLWFIMAKNAGKRNFIAYDRSANWVFVTTYNPKITPRETFTEERCRLLIDESIGAKVDYNIKGITIWHTTPQVAKYYRSRTIRNGFLAGDAAHCFPSTGGLGLNTGIGDVHNLVWKIDAVEKGVAQDSLLDTYEVERIPIAIANSSQSRLNEAKIHKLSEIVFGASSVTIEERVKSSETRQEIEKAIMDNRDHFDSLDLQIGYIYGQQRPRGKSVRDYTPKCISGARLPHGWVEADGRAISTLDLVDGLDFVLFCSQGFSGSEHQQSGKVRVKAVQLGKDFVDPDGQWSQLMGLEGGRAGVLVRPDQHICARVECSEDVADALVATLDATY